MAKAKLKLNKNDIILCVYPECASGPGWSNTILFVVIKDTCSGIIREECIQPEEQSLLIKQIFYAAYEITKLLKNEVKKLLKG
jgi:hypothetical protein